MMNRKLLPMMNVLNGGYIFTIFVFWIIPYMFMPSLRPFLGNGLWNDLGALGWIDLVCCAISGVGLILILKEHLGDTWFDVSVAPKDYIRPTLEAWILMMVWVLASTLFGRFWAGILTYMGNFFPVAEFSMNMVPILMLKDHPILSTLIFTMLTPFAVCGLFYAAGFAPLCSRKPILGYVGVIGVLVVCEMIRNFWYKQPDFAIQEFLFQLPVHLLACRAYQKTDNLWTPIFAIGLLNLTTSLLFFGLELLA